MSALSVRQAGHIRDDFPMLKHWTHMNCGGMAPMPRCVGAELLRVPQAVVDEGPLQLLGHEEAFLRHDAARESIARFINASPDEITFTTQFSTGVNIVIEGLCWNEGDEIIVSSEEHPALLIPILNLARRRNLQVHRLPISHNPEEMLAAFQNLLSPRTRLVAASHVTTDSGITLPVHEMTRLAHERGIRVMLDAAHSLGQFAVDVRELGCDYYVMVGYKWVMGPYPSAALFIRRDLLDQIDVTWTGSRATKGGGTQMDVDDLVWVEGAQRFEYGGRPFSYDTAMAAGIDYVASIGMENIARHSRRLSVQVCDALSAMPGARIESPLDPDRMTGIVTVALDAIDGIQFSAALRERFSIITRPALKGTSVRISLSAFIDENDIANLLDAIGTLANERA